MTLEPLLGAPLALQIHVATIGPAFLLGTWLILISRKGARRHRRVGYLYLALMTVTSVAAIFIHQANPQGPFGFSLIHLFIPMTLLGIAGALYGAWTHNIPLHRGAMIGTYIGAILIAGGFTFVPGRIMHEVAFG